MHRIEGFPKCKTIEDNENLRSLIKETENAYSGTWKMAYGVLRSDNRMF